MKQLLFISLILVVGLNVVIAQCPLDRTVTGSVAGCKGTVSPPYAITLASSQTGVYYQLKRYTQNAQSPKAGTGGTLTWTVDLDGTYTIVASKTGCSNVTMSTSAVITIYPLPIARNVIGSNLTACGSAANASIGIEVGTQTNVNYQLKLNGVNVGAPVTGNGSQILWTNVPDPGTYTISATTSNGCTTSMYGAVFVSLEPPPTQYTVSGGGTYCPSAGEPGVAITLEQTDPYVYYYIKFNGQTDYASKKNGYGGALTWTKSQDGVYTIEAQKSPCPHTLMNGSATVVTDYPPGMVPTGTNEVACEGAAPAMIGIVGGSRLDTYYQLRCGTNNVGPAVLGNGSTYLWTDITTTGSYTVGGINTRNCPASSTGVVNVIRNPLPTNYDVTVGTSCSNPYALGTGTITLNGSQQGVDYQLKNPFYNLGTVVSGTGNPIIWSNLNPGSYKISATYPSTGCSKVMNGDVAVTINSTPLVFEVSGGGTLCAGSPGFSIILGGSQTDAKYQLKINGIEAGPVKSGTGSQLTWPDQMMVGTYTVTATIESTACSIEMTGSGKINSIPSVYTVTGGPYCEGSPGASIFLSDSEPWVHYRLLLNNSYVTTMSGTGGPIAFHNRTMIGTYTIKTTQCDIAMNGSAVVFVNPAPVDFTVSGGGELCSDATPVITLSSSQAGINYQLKLGPVDVNTPLPGNGSSLRWKHVEPGTYTVEATNAVTGCKKLMTGNAIVTGDALCNTVNKWAFQYKYDGRRRITHKKVPGADWVYFVYDNRDRLVMTQDGEQRKQNKWTYTKYDALNRPIITGIYTHPALVDQAGMSSLISTTIFYETYNGVVRTDGYTNTVFSSSSFDQNDFQTLTVTYYDDYRFKTLLGAEFNYIPNVFSDQAVASDRVVGQITATKIRVLEQGNFLWSVNYFDDRYRTIQTVSNGMDGSLDRVTNVYDFVGKVKRTRTSHTDYSIKWSNITGPTTVDNISNTLKKTSTEVGWTVGATSQQILPEGVDGWVESTVGEVNTDRILGLSPANNDPDIASITYGILLKSSTNAFPIKIYQNGTQVINGPTTLRIGDVIRIERNGPAITFRHNGAVIPANVLPSTTGLVVDVSIYSGNGTWKDVRSSFAARTTSTTRSFEYDHTGRLLKTWHRVNEVDSVLLLQNGYNELGQLVVTKLHSEEPGPVSENQRTFKQHEDFRYNIRGWLTRINNSDLTPEESNNPRDLFGMNLIYNEPTPGLNNTPAFNGNISAIKWSVNQGLGVNIAPLESSELRERAYAFNYDTLDRLLSASHSIRNSQGQWNPVVDFNEDELRYDLNGNILGLHRNAEAGQIDNLEYTYIGNQLQDVNDTADRSLGFIEGNVGSVDYEYDANGNMTVDRNKSITEITYNHLNLPNIIRKQSGDYIKYIYDALGRKHSQSVYNTANVLQKRTDYAGEFFYENDTLKFINHEVGRVVMTGEVPEYQYYLKDHLGNVRLTFTSKHEEENAIATLEPHNAVEEDADFLYYDESVTVRAPVFDNTNNVPVGVDPDGYSVRLTGTSGNQYGLARSLSVMPGDTVKMGVFAKYVQRDGTGHWPGDITGLMENISNGVSTVVTDGGVPGSIGGGVFPFVGLINKSDETGTTPKAYLNYIVFDRRDTLVDFGYIRLTADAQESGANEPHEHLFKNDIVIRHPGYIYIYLSNENETPVEVFFDDFTVEHVKSPVIQTSDYYPYGLTFNSYQRENAVPNDLKFNGKEEQNELDLGWLDFGARMYLADMGRWSGVDPLAEKAMAWTPYRYGFDNPVKFIDPNGMFEYSNGYSNIDTRSESGSVSFSGSYEGNDGDIREGSSAGKTVYVEIDFGSAENSTDPIKKNDTFASQQGCPLGMRCEYNSKGEITRVESIDESWRIKSDVKLAKGYAEAVAIAAGGEIGGYFLARGLGYAISRFLTSGSAVTVLGRYPAYIELASELGAKRFNIPEHVWEAMSTSERWAANVKFLDRAIARGDHFMLSNSAFYAKQGTYFFRELQYLYSKGYKVADDGMSLMKP